MSTLKKKKIYRADHVGSLLRSEKVKDARRKFSEDAIDAEELKRIEDEEIARIVEKQKDLGLEAVTDGEFRRSWWHFDFLEGLTGVEGYWSGDGIAFKEKTTKSRAIKVTGKLDFNNHPMLRDFEYLKGQAGSTLPNSRFQAQACFISGVRSTLLYILMKKFSLKIWRMPIKKHWMPSTKLDAAISSSMTLHGLTCVPTSRKNR